MTALPTLIARARQGDAGAIAELITQSLATQGVVAQGQWQGTQLQLTLEANTAILQSRVGPHLRRRLQHLGLICPVDSVLVTAHGLGSPDAWQESFALGASASVAEAEPGVKGKGHFSILAPALASASGAGVAREDGGPPLPPDSEFSIDQGPDQLRPAAIPDTTLAALAHLAPLMSYVAVGGQWLGGWPLFWGGSFLLPWRVVVPLVLLLAKGRGERHAILGPGFVQQQAKAALNFQLTLVIAWALTIVLMLVLVGFLLVVPLALFEMVSCIISAVRASEGKTARCVGAIRFVR